VSDPDRPTSHAGRTGRRGRLLRAAAALALSSALALLAAELLLRASAPPRDGFFVWTPGLERTFHPDPARMPGIEGHSTFRIGSHGLRARELTPSDERRVLAVGGSTTECLYLDQGETWPALLEERLGPGAWVANAGVSGRLTRDHVVQMEHLLPALPPLEGVVMLVGVNDLMLVLGKGDAYDPRGLDAPGARERTLPRAFEVLPRELDPVGFPRSTELWRRVLAPLKARLSPPQAQDDAAEIYTTWRRHRREASRWIDELPDLAPALDEYERNVRAMASLCREAGARALFVTQPCLWSADPTPEQEALFWMGGVGDYQKTPGAAYYTAPALARGLAAFNERLRLVCAELGVDCLDLAALIPPDDAAFYDDVHFNEEGARRVASAIADVLR